MPGPYAELMKVRETLEQHYKDMQDLEFTIQQNKLYMLQTRNGKRTAAASAAHRGGHGARGADRPSTRRCGGSIRRRWISCCIRRWTRRRTRTLLAKGPAGQPRRRIGRGGVHRRRGGEPGAEGRGDHPGAHRDQPRGHPRHARRPRHPDHARRHDQPRGGGGARHGPPCVAGAGGLSVDYNAQTLSAGGKTVRAGETITLDGAAGEVFVGTVAMVEPAMSDDFATLMGWADKARTMGVRANAETPLDAETAKKFGADGIGLCRTEHMFFDPERIGAVRQMIMATDEAGRRAALARLLPFQRDDFHKLFRIMGDLPVTIRLLDPPLHEFLPHADAELAEVAHALGTNIEAMRRRAAELAEANPMLGHRGCRLGVTYPEIYEMQARAIFEGALEVAKETGKAPVPEIMIPLVGVRKELEITRAAGGQGRGGGVRRRRASGSNTPSAR